MNSNRYFIINIPIRNLSLGATQNKSIIAAGIVGAMVFQRDTP